MKTILVADDEAHLRLLVRTTLEEARYRILEAEDGCAAVEKAREEDPDLLILDWMMPGMSGIDVLKTLRGDARHASLPAIMLTARAQELDRELALRAGACGYLVKPFSPMQLLRLVTRVVPSGGE